MGVESLDLDPAGDNISLLDDYTSLIGGDVYPPEDASLGGSTTACHTSALKVKQETLLLTQ